MNDNQLAEKILALVGGEKNIKGVTHCVTRLRISVNDTSKIKAKEIQALPNVMGVNTVGNQFQVILGPKVVEVYNAFNSLVTISTSSGQSNQKEGLVSKFLDTLSGIFTPILPAIIGAGLLKGILIFLMFYGLVATDSDLFRFLDIFADSAFYFIPILLAVSTATRFNCNKYVAVAIAGILLHPNLINMMSESTSLRFLGIPVTNASYASSVLPIILGVWLMSYVEKGLNKVIPSILRTIMVPLFTLLIVAPVILIVLGPIGTIVGNAIGQGFIDFYLSTGPIAGAILGAVYPFLVILGMHVGFTPVMVQSLSKFGVDYMMALFSASNSGQAGATFAVYLKTKNKEFKAMAGTAALNAIIGITEPALFGVTTKLKRPLIGVSIGGAVGGAIAGFFKVQASGMGTGPIAGIPLFLGPTFVYFIISSAVACVVAFAVTWILGFEDIPEEMTEEDIENIEEEVVTTILVNEEVTSPLTGVVVPLDQVQDNVFAEKMMGDGVAVQPSVGKVIAPFDGVVEVAFETKHALGLKSFDGCEVLIHVGLDTVELKGQNFNVNVAKGDSFKKGDLLLEFDITAIEKAGYKTITPIVVTNTNMYQQIDTLKTGEIQAGTDLLKVITK